MTLSCIPSLRLIPAFECPYCGQILVQSEREDEYLCCPECGYSIPAVVPEQPESNR